MEYILKNSGTKLLVFGTEFADTVAELHNRGDKTEIQTWIQINSNNKIQEFTQNYTTLREEAPIDRPVIGAGEEMKKIGARILIPLGAEGLRGIIFLLHDEKFPVPTVDVVQDLESLRKELTTAIENTFLYKDAMRRALMNHSDVLPKTS